MREGNEQHRRRAERNAPITKRSIDEGRARPGRSAARRGRRSGGQRTDPDHPTRIEREMSDTRGIQDPAHSRGTGEGK